MPIQQRTKVVGRAFNESGLTWNTIIRSVGGCGTIGPLGENRSFIRIHYFPEKTTCVVRSNYSNLVEVNIDRVCFGIFRMKPTVSILASGLKLLSFQGVTTFQDEIVVATVEGDLIRVAPDGTLTTWVNVARYGIPTGIVGLRDRIIVALSAQESHFLMQVTQQGKLLPLADLSILAGEFGAPLAVAAYEGYYPYYMVAISTDVVGSAGLIAKVTSSGRTTVLATLANTSFGVGIGEDYVIATQEKGQVVKISFAGKARAIVTLDQTSLGFPLDITRLAEEWIITTTTGWLVALKPDDTLSPLIDTSEMGYGSPTTLTTFENQLVVATQTGNLLQVVV